MKLKNISCTQFAGIRERNIKLDNGINVIYGKNESGKSTLVNLISRTLFQNARIDGRTDKDFRELYFPGAIKGSNIPGDFADGKITFESENGTYTLSKEWGADSRCTLSTPDGIIKDQKTIDSVLKSVLLYGEGVYADMLLSSQRNTDTSLQTLLDAAKKTDAKQEITSSVSRAFAESDGIAIDAIEDAINSKIEEIGGKHWDFEKELPVRRAGRWSVGLGQILKAYYAFEDAKAVLDELSRTEMEFDIAADDYAKKDNEVKIAENAFKRFNTYAGKLAVQNERKKSLERLDKELNKVREVLDTWPKIAAELEKAKALWQERSNRTVLDKYENAKNVFDELKKLDQDILKQNCPTADEALRIKAGQRDISKLENKLCGMNLNAAITLLENHNIEIISLRTGEKLDILNGNTEITEAVKISIPGIAEIQLSPKDVNVCEVETKINEHKKIISEIFSKYSVESIEELENLTKEITNAKSKFENASNRLNLILDGEKFEDLESKAKELPTEIRAEEDIEHDIYTLCAAKDASKFITAKETLIENYTTEYISVSELKARAYDLEIEYKKATDAITDSENIPEEYAHITDPESHLEALQAVLKDKQIQRDTALTLKTSAAGKLEAYSSAFENDPKEEFLKAERIFNETKSLLTHWMHIYEIFKIQKENINNNPMQDIADSFTKYLELISDNKISSEFPEADKLNMNIYSDRRLLDYRKLSEGTKETVSLAFRLSVLDHLFPNGGGVLVLDDSFTDMDIERTEQSCKLIKECAKMHQVIFLTCHKEYLNMLGGNIITL